MSHSSYRVEVKTCAHLIVADYADLEPVFLFFFPVCSVFLGFFFLLLLFVFFPPRVAHLSRHRLGASAAASSGPVTYLITQFDMPPWAPGLCGKFPFLPPHPPPHPPSFSFHTLTLLCHCLRPALLLILPPRRKESEEKKTFLTENTKAAKGGTSKQRAMGVRGRKREGRDGGAFSNQFSRLMRRVHISASWNRMTTHVY